MDIKYREQLEMVHKLGLQVARQIEINLAVAAIDQEYNLAGNYVYVKDAPDQTSYIDIKINASNQPAISWVKQTGFIHPFNRLYITTPSGQTGTMKILIAAEAPELFAVVDNRSAISESMNDVLGELQGDITPEDWGLTQVDSDVSVEILNANANRKGCIIQAESANAGIVYIGFDNTVTYQKWVAELQPSQAFSVDDYRGPLFGRASAMGQFVGRGEW